MKQVTVDEVHAVWDALTRPHETTGRRIEQGGAVLVAMGLMLDARLTAIEQALRMLKPGSASPRPTALGKTKTTKR